VWQPATPIVFANWSIQASWSGTSIDGFAYNLSRKILYIESAWVTISHSFDLQKRVLRTKEILIQKNIQPADRLLVQHWFDDLISTNAVIQVDYLLLKNNLS
jgi:hypothetical protein